VGKLKQLWFSVGTFEAKRFRVGDIKTNFSGARSSTGDTRVGDNHALRHDKTDADSDGKGSRNWKTISVKEHER